MKNNLNICFVICLLAISNCFKIKAKLQNDLYGPELIVNGGFEKPVYNGNWGLLDAEGWTHGNAPIEIGRGSIYNSLWGDNNQVCELDSTANSVISQIITLDARRECTLELDYASRVVVLETNGLTIKYNDKILEEKITPDNYNVIHYKATVEGKKGENKIELSGSNTSDSFGITIDNVSFKCKLEELKEETEEKKCKKNYIKNGDFENPNQNGDWSILTKNFIPGWNLETGNIEVGRGTIYNSGWEGNGQVCELDSNQNVVISQEIKLKENKNCELKFQWATRNGHLDNNGFRIKVGDKIILTVSPADYNIHNESFIFSLTKGLHTFTFEATGKSDSYGVTIDNVEVHCCDSYTLPPNPVC